MSTTRLQRLEDRIRDYILAEVVAGASSSEISNSSPLITAGLLDSLAMMRLVGFLEKEFSISIESDDLSIENLDNVDFIASFVKRKTSLDL